METRTYRMLAFDLDGTLLTSEKTVSLKTAAALEDCKAAGYAVTYITARSPRKTKSLLAGLPCDFIAHYNGALIYQGDCLVAKNQIPYEQAMALVRGVRQIGRAHV